MDMEIDFGVDDSPPRQMPPPNQAREAVYAKILNDELFLLDKTREKVQDFTTSFDKFDEEHYDALKKMIVQLEQMQDNFVPSYYSWPEQLSVTAQHLICKTADKAEKMLESLHGKHVELHAEVSKLGQEINMRYKSETGKILKGEKEIVEDEKNRDLVCCAINDMLVSEGLVNCSITMVDECELSKRDGNVQKLPAVMSALRRHNVKPSIDFINKGSFKTDYDSLLFDLYKNQVLEHVVNKRKLDKHFDANVKLIGKPGIRWDEIPRIMGAMVFGLDAVEYPRYADFFEPERWEVLVSEVSKLIVPFHSHLPRIIDAGCTVMSLIENFQKNVQPTFDVSKSNELPIETETMAFHSTFNCPILKEQNSPSNPPMKLVCGHVISKEALGRLSTTRGGRNSHRPPRLKCPYCPKEQPQDAAKQVNFANRDSSRLKFVKEWMQIPEERTINDDDDDDTGPYPHDWENEGDDEDEDDDDDEDEDEDEDDDDEEDDDGDQDGD